MKKLENTVSIVTGGIGRGFVKHCLDLGARVAVVDIVDQTRGEATLADMGGGGNVMYLMKDI